MKAEPAVIEETSAGVVLVLFNQREVYSWPSRALGAQVHNGGIAGKLEEDLAGGYYIQPTLLKGHSKVRIFQ